MTDIFLQAAFVFLHNHTFPEDGSNLYQTFTTQRPSGVQSYGNGSLQAHL